MASIDHVEGEFGSRILLEIWSDIQLRHEMGNTHDTLAVIAGGQETSTSWFGSLQVDKPVYFLFQNSSMCTTSIHVFPAWNQG